MSEPKLRRPAPRKEIKPPDETNVKSFGAVPMDFDAPDQTIQHIEERIATRGMI